MNSDSLSRGGIPFLTVQPGIWEVGLRAAHRFMRAIPEHPPGLRHVFPTVSRPILEGMAGSVCLGLLLTLAGCSATGTSLAKRAAGVGLGGAGGALLGHELSDGDPLATVGGAAAGALAVSLFQGSDPAVLQAGFDQGYLQGQADSIRRQYWLRQALERERQRPEDTRSVVHYLLPGPTITEDGRILEPHTIAVPVIE
jgi:hypothetical protein